MSQQTLSALAEGYALLQNGCLPRDVFDASCSDLLKQLVNNSSVSWADRQQALIASSQHGVCQQVLLEAGQQLWQLRMESCRLATDAGGCFVYDLPVTAVVQRTPGSWTWPEIVDNLLLAIFFAVT